MCVFPFLYTGLNWFCALSDLNVYVFDVTSCLWFLPRLLSGGGMSRDVASRRKTANKCRFEQLVRRRRRKSGINVPPSTLSHLQLVSLFPPHPMVPSTGGNTFKSFWNTRKNTDHLNWCMLGKGSHQRGAVMRIPDWSCFPVTFPELPPWSCFPIQPMRLKRVPADSAQGMLGKSASTAQL